MMTDDLNVLSLLFLRLASSSGSWPLAALDLHHNSFLPTEEREGETLNSPSMSVRMKFHWSGLDFVLIFEQIWRNVLL